MIQTKFSLTSFQQIAAARRRQPCDQGIKNHFLSQLAKMRGTVFMDNKNHNTIHMYLSHAPQILAKKNYFFKKRSSQKNL
jgi:hypothetical protein